MGKADPQAEGEADGAVHVAGAVRRRRGVGEPLARDERQLAARPALREEGVDGAEVARAADGARGRQYRALRLRPVELLPHLGDVRITSPRTARLPRGVG